MKHPLPASAVSLALFIAGCHSAPHPNNAGNNGTSVSVHEDIEGARELEFKEARNYFVRNTVTDIADPRIMTAVEFDAVFGMATTMGADGRPTEIDFEQEFVIAVILPETDTATEVIPDRLEKDGNGGITLWYRRTVGAVQSFTTRPFAAIIVDRSESAPVELEEMM